MAVEHGSMMADGSMAEAGDGMAATREQHTCIRAAATAERVEATMTAAMPAVLVAAGTRVLPAAADTKVLPAAGAIATSKPF